MAIQDRKEKHRPEMSAHFCREQRHLKMYKKPEKLELSASIVALSSSFFLSPQDSVQACQMSITPFPCLDFFFFFFVCRKDKGDSNLSILKKSSEMLWTHVKRMTHGKWDDLEDAPVNALSKWHIYNLLHHLFTVCLCLCVLVFIPLNISAIFLGVS